MVDSNQLGKSGFVTLSTEPSMCVPENPKED